jgi:hypothetical protein
MSRKFKIVIFLLYLYIISKPVTFIKTSLKIRHKKGEMSSSVKTLLRPNLQYVIDVLMDVTSLCLARHLISRIDNLV